MSVRYIIGIWFFYFLGQAAHIYARADLSTSSPLNGITSYRQYFRHYSSLILFRLSAETMLFMAWVAGHNMVAETAARVPFLAGGPEFWSAWGVGLGAEFIFNYLMTKLGIEKAVPPMPGSEAARQLSSPT